MIGKRHLEVLNSSIYYIVFILISNPQIMHTFKSMEERRMIGVEEGMTESCQCN